MKKIASISFLGILTIGLIVFGIHRFLGSPSVSAAPKDHPPEDNRLLTGAEQTEKYFPLLQGKRVAVAGNHSSLIGETHLVDSLVAAGIEIVKVFSPEHGFRGKAADGELVESGTDPETGLKVVSLYGASRRPTGEQLQDLDVILFDIQDVGTRFYTYISTMSYIMEEAAKQQVPMIVLDRPNPNGHYVDGPILQPEFSSFVGLHPIPVVHGMTIGEYARMVNGEGWLGENLEVDLKVIPIKNYTRQTYYELPVPPSPNLPNMRAVYLYPSLCFFERTQVSVGRGTPDPFQIFGHSSFKESKFSYTFTPQSVSASPNPPLKGEKCFGRDLREIPMEELRAKDRINLEYLLEAYRHFPDQDNFFLDSFERLMGNAEVRRQIIAGWSEEQIHAEWQEDLVQFRKMRRPYLLYPDLE